MEKAHPAATPEVPAIRGTSVSRRVRRILVRLAFLIGSVLVAVVVVELVGRLVLRGVADDARYDARLEELVLRAGPILPPTRLPGKFDPKFGVVLTPHREFTEHQGDRSFTQKTNALGFFTHEVIPRRPGEYRVLLVGDSFFYGSFIKDAERVGAQLEDLAREDEDARRPLKVYNFALPGYCGNQELVVARTYAAQVDADAVVLGVFAGNDAIANALTSVDEAGNFVTVPENIKRYQDELRGALGPLRHSLIARVLSFTQPAGTWLYYRIARRDWVIDGNRRVLKRFRDFCDEEGLDCGVVLQMTKDSLDTGVRGRVFNSAEVNDALNRVCDEEGLPFIDMRQVFHEAGDWRAFIHQPPDAHPNAKGTRLTAEAIYRRWIKAKLAQAHEGVSTPSSP